MNVKQRTWQTLCEPKYGKPVKITVWRNGEFDCPGQEITLHPKCLRSWNSLLGFLTVVLAPRWGAVRKLYHLDTKKLVLCLQEIKQNQKYVAVGGDKLKFKKNGYMIEDGKMENDKTENKGSDDQFDDSLAKFMAYTKKKKRRVVYFMVSGRSCQPPVKVVFIERDFLDYHMILHYLAHRLDVGEGIQNLCNTNGKNISCPSELRHGGVYVAVPYGSSFMKLDYNDLFTKMLPLKIVPSTTKRIRPKKVRSNVAKGQSTKLEAVQEEEQGSKSEKEDEEEEDGAESDDEDSQPDMPLVPPKIVNEEADLQVVGLAFDSVPSPPAATAKLSSDYGNRMDSKASSQGVLQIKCVGEKCLDFGCRLLRNEYASTPVVLEDDTGKHSKAASEIIVQTPQTANEMKEYMDEMHDTVEEILDDIVDYSLVQVEEKGVSPIDFDKGESDKQPSDESTTTITAVQKTVQEKNMTTFADIAKNKRISKPLIPSRRGSLTSYTSSSSPSKRRGVSFLQVHKPETIFESPEERSRTSEFQHNLIKNRQASVLNFREDALNDVSLHKNKSLTGITEEGVEKNESVAEKSQRKGWESPSSLKKPKRKATISILKQTNLYQLDGDRDFCIIPKEKGFKLAANSVIQLKQSVSKAVQKDTIGMEKETQVASDSAQLDEPYYYDLTRPSNTLYYNENADFSDIYHNFEKEGASVKFSVVASDSPVNSKTKPEDV